MNGIPIRECEQKAQEEGFDSATFTLAGPTGLLKCKWIDAYLGVLELSTEDRKHLCYTNTVEVLAPDALCYDFSANKKNE